MNMLAEGEVVVKTDRQMNRNISRWSVMQRHTEGQVSRGKVSR
jgi:hypothetical protein